MLVVPLPFAKASREPMQLRYELRPAEGVQPRLAGRLVAKPVIDLGAYACRAVVDWLALSLVFRRQTQFRYVQQVMVRVGIGRPYVKPVDWEEGRSTNEFYTKIQDASPDRLRNALAALDTEFGLVGSPAVEGIEISVDFRPRAPSDIARLAMVGVLGRHLYTTRDIVRAGGDRPRYSAARGESVFLVGDSGSSRSLNRLRCIDSDRPWPVDSTLMIGRKHGPVQWKAMDKLLDVQHPDGSRIELLDAEKRARIEITLNHAEVRAIGISTVDDLSHVSFTKLQGRYFRFMLPSFSRPMGRLAAVTRHFEGLRYKRFANAGVAGLVLMDAAYADNARRNEGWLHRDLRSRQMAIVRTRAGKGVDQRYSAYKELNDRVSGALEKLGDRWKQLRWVKGMHSV